MLLLHTHTQCNTTHTIHKNTYNTMSAHTQIHTYTQNTINTILISIHNNTHNAYHTQNVKYTQMLSLHNTNTHNNTQYYHTNNTTHTMRIRIHTQTWTGYQYIIYRHVTYAIYSERALRRCRYQHSACHHGSRVIVIKMSTSRRYRQPRYRGGSVPIIVTR